MFDDTGVAAVGVNVADLDLEAVFDNVIESGSAWSALSPSGLLLDVLAGLSAESLDADAALEAAAALQRVIGFAQAAQLRSLARFAALRPAEAPGRAHSEFAADEAAPVLRVGRHAAAARMALGCDLVGRLPETLRALQEVDLSKARAVSELTASPPDEQAAHVQARVLPRAGTQTPAQLRAAIRREVIRVDPDGAARRETAARADRSVTVTPVEDGMAELWALLPAAEAVAAYDRAARTLPADGRTADQRRADTLTDLLLGDTPHPAHRAAHADGTAHTANRAAHPANGAAHTGPAAHPGPAVTARINVTVPAATLAGRDQQPGELAGYGPITAHTARELAAGALTADTTWRRLLTHPTSGQVLHAGRRRYRPPAALTDLVHARDRTCRFPWLPHPRRPLRPRPHHPLPPRRHQPRRALPPPPPTQTPHQLARHPTPNRPAHLDQPHRPTTHHRTRAGERRARPVTHHKRRSLTPRRAGTGHLMLGRAVIPAAARLARQRSVEVVGEVAGRRRDILRLAAIAE